MSSRVSLISRLRWLLGFVLIQMAFSSVPVALDEKRPEDGIYDPGKMIPLSTRAAIIGEIRSVRESSGVDLLIAVTPKPASWEGQAYADALADRWGYHGGRALVLWVPDEPKNPWVSISGLIRSELPKVELDAISTRAIGRAAADARSSEAIRNAVVSLGEDLRFAAAKLVRASNTPKPQIQISGKDALLLILWDSKKLLMIGGGILIAVLVAIYLIFKMSRGIWLSLTPRIFPEVSLKRRFGAPHSGIAYTSSPSRRNL